MTTTKEVKMKNVIIEGIEYAPVVNKPTGNRAIVVVDRGWMFAGDVTRENGRIKMSRVLWLFRWEAVGFAAMVANPKSPKVDIRPFDDVDIPEVSEIFCVPVSDNWGL
jgi:hypothetical protein